MDLEASVGHRERRDTLGPVRIQVGRRDQPAGPSKSREEALRELSPVEGLAAVLRDRSKGPGEVRLPEHVTGTEAGAPWQEQLAALRVCRESVAPARDRVREDG